MVLLPSSVTMAGAVAAAPSVATLLCPFGMPLLQLPAVFQLPPPATFHAESVTVEVMVRVTKLPVLPKAYCRPLCGFRTESPDTPEPPSVPEYCRRLYVPGFVQRVVTDGLGDWLERNPAPARDVIRKAISAAQARMAARKARDNARRKSPLESFGMPGKLSDCSSKNPEKCEVYIVEGDSAGGSAKRGRNPETQAILPLRGKILNVERARLDKALGNAEVQSMITAFGTGIGEDFDLSKLRYHKIVLMADADVDGQHITTLLMTLLFRYMRPLIENGYVYLAQPPLYRIKWSNAAHDYVYSDRERDAKLVAGQAAGRRIPKDNGIQRYKGLGEMDYTELWDTTMDPDHRTLLQVTMDDALAADQIFSVLMGEDVESRRNFIQQNAKDVRFLDI